MYLYQFVIHFCRLVHIVSHSDHVTVRQCVLIRANVPDINAYMNAMTNIFDLVVFHALVSPNALVQIVYLITLNVMIVLYN